MPKSISISSVQDPNAADVSFYGAAREFMRCRDPEVIIHGPAETGKTFGALWLLHMMAMKYRDASLLILRKTLSSAYSTVIETFIQKVLGGRDKEKDWICKAYGGSKPQWFDYPNGSRIWVAGLDKSSKILSAERDVIYVNQAEELELKEWETLTTRTTGRSGNMPYAQCIGDANPAWPKHWLYTRDGLRVIQSLHTDNPTLYDQETGEMTKQGERTMSTLMRLTGVRRVRLLEGRAAQPQGMIYPCYNEVTHREYEKDVPWEKINRFAAAQDWGYTNPGALGVGAQTYDGDIYIIAQHYHTRRRIDWWVKRMKEFHEEFELEAVVCDPSEPAYIEDYNDILGLTALKAFTDFKKGRDEVEKLLEEGRLFFVRDSLRKVDPALDEAEKPLCVEDEFMGYVWADTTTKEVPKKQDDHGMDWLRYLVCYLMGVGVEELQEAGSWRPK